MKVLDDGEDVLDDEQFDRKKSSVHSALDKAYGTKGALTHDEIAAMINDVDDASGDGDKSGDESASSGAEETALQKKSEIQSAGAGLFGFSRFLAAAKATPKAAPAGTSGGKSQKRSGTGTTPKVSSGPARHKPQVSSGQTGQVKVVKGSSSSKGSRQISTEVTAVRHLDGRNERLHMNVGQDCDKISKTLREIKDKLASAHDDKKDGQGKKF